MTLNPADPEGVASRFVGPLFGIQLMQARIDPKWIKWMVTWTIFIEAISSSLASFISYDYAYVACSLLPFCVITAILPLRMRVKRLLGKQWLAIVIWISAVIQMLCVTGVAAGDSIVTSFLAFQQFKPVRVVVIIWMVLAPVTDLFIAGLLVYFLRKSRTGFRKTDSMLNRLALLVIQTGAITALGAMLGLLLFPDFIHLLFIFTLPSSYGVCLLASLNARAAWSFSLNGEHTYHGGWTTEGERTQQGRTNTTIITDSEATPGDIELGRTVTGPQLVGTYMTKNGCNFAQEVRRRSSHVPPFTGVVDPKRRPSNEYLDVKRRVSVDDGLSFRSFEYSRGERETDPLGDDLDVDADVIDISADVDVDQRETIKKGREPPCGRGQISLELQLPMSRQSSSSTGLQPHPSPIATSPPRVNPAHLDPSWTARDATATTTATTAMPRAPEEAALPDSNQRRRDVSWREML
ncbi:hypothetical protein DL93DRAFT_2087288 [Clavulina sp. PMI_390]|nr:hypothetical protein DL93DRAFT_2087288 [Clavulina sp. PMI_390]